MNHVVQHTLASLLTITGLSSCAITQEPAPNIARIIMPRCTLERNANGEGCLIRIFDGVSIQIARRDGQGRSFIDVPAASVTGPRVALYQAPGYEPQVQALKMIVGESDHVDLHSRSDTRGGILVGVVYKPALEEMEKGICGIENFLANREVVVFRGRARYTTTTNSIGSFSLELPAGDYAVRVEGEGRDVVVPQNDSVFVTLPVAGS